MRAACRAATKWKGSWPNPAGCPWTERAASWRSMSGKDMTTEQFATLLNSETTFVIGGPDGLEQSVKKGAALLLRLSSLTLPHALAQVVLMEQIYRAATLLTGHPYHRA